MVDRSISFEQRVGAKWCSVSWPVEADEPEVRWRLEQNGSPASSIEIEVRAGARRVSVSWPAGKYEAKVNFWDYQAQEGFAQYKDANWGVPSDKEI